MHGGLFVTSIFIVLVVCEGLLRVLDISYPVFDDFDDERGIRLRPGKQGWYRAEGEAYLSINSLGYRDREHDRAKPENTVRIAVLGDSFVEARQVPLEDTFWYRLGLELRACDAFDGRQIEMFSFGIGGYNTSQEYLTLQKDVLGFSPDLVILAMFPGNDIEGNWRRPADTGAWRISAPTHKIVDGDLVIDHQFNTFPPQIFLYKLSHYSRVAELVNEVRRTIRAWRWQSSAPKEIEIGLDAAVLRPPQSPEWHDAWLITEALLASMNDLVQRRGARFIVTTLPFAAQVDPVRQRREETALRVGAGDWLFPDQQITEMGSRTGFQVYALTKELQDIAEEKMVYIHGFTNTRLGHGHLNKEGHRFVAELLAKKLCGWKDLEQEDRQMAAARSILPGSKAQAQRE
jgi:hypothetical protein